MMNLLLIFVFLLYAAALFLTTVLMKLSYVLLQIFTLHLPFRNLRLNTFRVGFSLQDLVELMYLLVINQILQVC
uniref:Candidate secreted effector n=1 Tax=Meloidogyne incognita TaxID=6306 RepID=A0A914KXI4_MELIC